MPRLRRPGTASSRPSSAGARAAPSAPRSRAPGPRTAPTATPLSAVAEETSRAAPIGIGELDRVLGGGLVAGRRRPARRRAGDRQVDARCSRSPPGWSRDAGSAAGASCTRPARSRRRRSACARPARAARRRRRRGGSGSSPRTTSTAIVEAARAEPPAVLVVDSVQTAMVAELDGPRRQRRPGPRGDAPADGLREGRGDRGRPRRPRHQGRLDRRAPRPSSTSSTRSSSLEGERTSALRLLRAIEEPLRVDRGGRRLRDGRARPGRGRPTRPGRSSPSTTSRRPGSVVAPTLEGSRPLLVEVQALVAPAGYGSPTRRASGLDPNRLGLLLAVLGRRAGVGLAGHDVYANLAGGLTRRRTRPGPAARPRPRLVPARPAGRVRAWSPSARSACSGSCGPVPGLDRRLREAARLGFGARRSCPGPRRGGRSGRRPRRHRGRSRVATLADGRSGARARCRFDRGVASPCRRC